VTVEVEERAKGRTEYNETEDNETQVLEFELLFFVLDKITLKQMGKCVSIILLWLFLLRENNCYNLNKKYIIFLKL
jgi:hypothetical protein